MAEPRREPPAARPGLIGPFSARQLATVLVVVVMAAVALSLANTSIAPGPGGATPLPAATPYVVGSATTGLQPGDLAPEFAVTGADGTTGPLLDLAGNPVRLADLRGQVLWLNFWATWCPPCQSETPVLRDIAAAAEADAFELIGIAVQETTPDDVRAYANRYSLGYTVAFDASADVFDQYRVYALPTQVFIDRDGRILQIVNGPMTTGSARSILEQWLPGLRDPGHT